MPTPTLAPHPQTIFGCMRIGGSWDANPTDAATRHKAFESLDVAIAEGFTWFDHADIYCSGKSEQLFGEYLRKGPSIPREEMVIQSKTGIRFAGTGGKDTVGRFDFSAQHITDSVDSILKRLDCEYLDILLLHRPDALTDPIELGDTLGRLFESGKVRNFGVSNHGGSRLELLKKYSPVPFVANQLELSLGQRQLVENIIHLNQEIRDYNHSAAGTLDYCRLNDITVQVWSPLYHGLFTGASVEGKSPAIQATAKLVSRLAAEYQCSREAIALAWIRRIPGAIVPVIGTTNPDRIRACAQNQDLQLSREHWYELLVSARGTALP